MQDKGLSQYTLHLSQSDVTVLHPALPYILIFILISILFSVLCLCAQFCSCNLSHFKSPPHSLSDISELHPGLATALIPSFLLVPMSAQISPAVYELSFCYSGCPSVIRFTQHLICPHTSFPILNHHLKISNCCLFLNPWCLLLISPSLTVQHFFCPFLFVVF